MCFCRVKEETPVMQKLGIMWTIDPFDLLPNFDSFVYCNHTYISSLTKNTIEVKPGRLQGKCKKKNLYYSDYSDYSDLISDFVCKSYDYISTEVKGEVQPGPSQGRSKIKNLYNINYPHDHTTRISSKIEHKVTFEEGSTQKNYSRVYITDGNYCNLDDDQEEEKKMKEEILDVVYDEQLLEKELIAKYFKQFDDKEFGQDPLWYTEFIKNKKEAEEPIMQNR